MLGNPSHRNDALSGLLRVVRNDASVASHIELIQKKESAFREFRIVALKEVADAKEKLVEDRATLDTAATKIAERESAVSKREAEHKAKTATADSERNTFEEWKAKTTADLARQEMQLKESTKTLNDRVKEATKKEQELNTRAKMLDETDRRNGARSTELDKLAAMLKFRETALETTRSNLTDRLAKLQELAL